MTRKYEKLALDRNDLKRYCKSQWLVAVLDNDKEIPAYWDRKKQIVFAVHSYARYIRFFIGRADKGLIERYNRKETEQ